MTCQRPFNWELDRWQVEHFYGRDAGTMTLPQFISALENIPKVREELRPKTAQEIHARIIAENAKAQDAALRQKLEKARGGGS